MFGEGILVSCLGDTVTLELSCPKDENEKVAGCATAPSKGTRPD